MCVHMFMSHTWRETVQRLRRHISVHKRGDGEDDMLCYRDFPVSSKFYAIRK